VSSLAFAFGAGLLAPLNPCGFAMLPAFLGYYLGEAPKDRAASSLARLAQGFAVGAAVSLGFAAAFAAAALVVSLGLRSLVSYVPWAAAVIGILLVAIGLPVIGGRTLALRPIERLRPAQGRAFGRMALFGAAYATASLSCTLAILLVVVAQALAMSNPAGILGVLTAYAAGAATVLTAVSVSTALARDAVARRLRRMLPYVGRLGGVLLVASGLYLVAYWLPVLTGSSTSPVGGFSAVVSGRLGDLVDAHQAVLVAVALMLVAGGGFVAVRSRRGGREFASEGSHPHPAPPPRVQPDDPRPPLRARAPSTEGGDQAPDGTRVDAANKPALVGDTDQTRHGGLR
jgi:cytochrome c-type biogenesis protein